MGPISLPGACDALRCNTTHEPSPAPTFPLCGRLMQGRETCQGVPFSFLFNRLWFILVFSLERPLYHRLAGMRIEPRPESTMTTGLLFGDMEHTKDALDDSRDSSLRANASRPCQLYHVCLRIRTLLCSPAMESSVCIVLSSFPSLLHLFGILFFWAARRHTGSGLEHKNIIGYLAWR